VTAFIIRDAESKDIQESVFVLRRAIVESCKMDHHGISEFIDSWLVNKTDEHMVKWMEDKSLHLKVALVAERVVGVGMCTAAGEISLCYVLPEFQSLGIGRAIVVALESVLEALGFRRSVLISTKTGLEFYSHLGYEISGKVVSSNGMNGIPMRRDFCMSRVPFW